MRAAYSTLGKQPVARWESELYCQRVWPQSGPLPLQASIFQAKGQGVGILSKGPPACQLQVGKTARVP